MSTASSKAEDRSAHIQAIFDEVVDLNEHDRSARLEKLCRDDVLLREEVESLLRAFDKYVYDVSLAPDIADLDAEDPLIGQQIKGYKIISLIASGGMGRVYKGQHIDLGSHVAIKVLNVPQSIRKDIRAEERFLQEAKTVANLDHPNIAYVHDIALKGDQHFIIMRYYEGESIKDRLKRGPIPLEEAIDYAIQIANGLQEAHRHGIVHRDIKPANLIISSGNVIKIIDFGLAKVGEESLGSGTLVMLGTEAYASPEQLQNALLDHRSDIWSLGMTFYEMLTGKKAILPHRQKELQQINLHEAPQLERVISKCLALNRENRYASIAHFLADLRKKTKPFSAIKKYSFSKNQIQSKYNVRTLIRTPIIVLFALTAIGIVLKFGLNSTVNLSTCERFSEKDSLVKVVIFDFERKDQADPVFTSRILESLNEGNFTDLSIKHVNQNINIKNGGSKKARQILECMGADLGVWGYYLNELEVVSYVENLDKGPWPGFDASESERLSIPIRSYPEELIAARYDLADILRIRILTASFEKLLRGTNYLEANTLAERALEYALDYKREKATHAVLMDTTISGLYLSLGYIRLTRKRRVHASQTFEKVIRNKEATSHQKYYAYMSLQLYDEAIELYPKRFAAYNNRGVRKRVLGDYEAALKDFDLTYRYSTERWKYYVYINRAMTYILMHEPEKAFDEYEKAIRHSPSQSYAYLLRSRLNKKLGKRLEGIQDSILATQKLDYKP